MEKLNSKLYVYTRNTEKYYPAGLANSIHFSYTLEGSEKQCLNRNYGILFAEAIILDDNTLLPLGVRDPQIYIMDDGYIGITAIRILENGAEYKPEEHKVLFWKTKDLIEFTDEELIERDVLSRYNLSENIEVSLGLLSADEDKDLLDISNWTKSKNPVLDFYSVKGEYGCGHNSFFVNEDGELMMAYHGETDIDSHLRCDGIRRVHFRKDNTPYFKMSQDEDLINNDVIIRIKL